MTCNQLDLQTVGPQLVIPEILPDQFRGAIEYTSLIEENRRMWICNQLDSQTVGPELVMREDPPTVRGGYRIYPTNRGKHENVDM